MILIRNNDAVSTPVSIKAYGSTVPFDTVELNTNGDTSFSGNAVSINIPGVYTSECMVTVENEGGASVNITLTTYADGTAVSGASSTVTVPSGEYAQVCVPWTDIAAYDSQKKTTVSWFISGGSVNITNAIAIVTRLN